MTNRTIFSWDLYFQAPIVGILRGISVATVLRIAEAYQQAGFRTLEITMNTPGAADIISTVRNNFPELNVGAGTVCNLAQYQKAVASGAQFVVMPILNEEVVKKAVTEGLTIFPGAYTPTEIYKAWKLGASAVKVFPASQLGVQYIKEVLAPLDEIKLLPTGGVSKNNIRSFFEIGAVGVGMGSSLFNKKFVQAGDFDGLNKHFVSIRQEIKDFTKTP